ncbi:hypothetical protein [Mucilaginibacter sp.]|uniref:hypothetical protein n=1 Tax=Mucilaginibacter sp. TaxID=1882438 RepID=UPI0035BBC0FF
MNKSVLFLASAILMAVAACNNNKPKPTSNDIVKQTVTINGKKDSVLNNARKNYGNATVSEPCVRCLIQAVQATAEYKNAIVNVTPEKISYNINWVTGEGNADTVNTKGATNALKVIVLTKGSETHKFPYFIYDNTAAKLFVAGNGTSEKKEVKIDDLLLKKIRNACYWGVASGK